MGEKVRESCYTPAKEFVGGGKGMPTHPLFPLPEGLELTSVSEGTDAVLVRVTSLRESSLCPLCSLPSTSIHSYYRRHPMDLPCAGRPIRLLLTVRKFFCHNQACSRKIFTERVRRCALIPRVGGVQHHWSKHG